MKYNIFNERFDHPEEPIKPEWAFERLRIERDRRLAASDWAMASDAPTDKTEWAAYRQALRDFPATWTPGPVAEFPLAPGEEPAPTVEEVEAAPDAPSTNDVGGSDPDAISDGL